jgi:predicted HicB family RNase H-like nuclease
MTLEDRMVVKMSPELHAAVTVAAARREDGNASAWVREAIRAQLGREQAALIDAAQGDEAP